MYWVKNSMSTGIIINTVIIFQMEAAVLHITYFKVIHDIFSVYVDPSWIFVGDHGQPRVNDAMILPLLYLYRNRYYNKPS